MEKDVAILIEASEALQDFSKRRQAEEVLLQFSKRRSPYELCVALLQSSSTNAQFQSSVVLCSALMREYDTLPQEARQQLRHAILQMTVGKPYSPPVKSQLLRAISIMHKREWASGTSSEDSKNLARFLVKEVVKSETACDLALSLIQEFSAAEPRSCGEVGIAWQAHVKCHRQFETNVLPALFLTCVNTLARGASHALHLLKCVNAILRWSFAEGVDDNALYKLAMDMDALEVREGIKPGRSWSHLADPELTSLLQHLHTQHRGTPMATEVMQTVQLLGSLCGTVFSGNAGSNLMDVQKRRFEFAERLLCLVCTIHSQGSKLPEIVAVLNALCKSHLESGLRLHITQFTDSLVGAMCDVMRQVCEQLAQAAARKDENSLDFWINDTLDEALESLSYALRVSKIPESWHRPLAETAAVYLRSRLNYAQYEARNGEIRAHRCDRDTLPAHLKTAACLMRANMQLLVAETSRVAQRLPDEVAQEQFWWLLKLFQYLPLPSQLIEVATRHTQLLLGGSCLLSPFVSIELLQALMTAPADIGVASACAHLLSSTMQGEDEVAENSVKLLEHFQPGENNQAWQSVLHALQQAIRTPGSSAHLPAQVAPRLLTLALRHSVCHDMVRHVCATTTEVVTHWRKSAAADVLLTCVDLMLGVVKSPVFASAATVCHQPLCDLARVSQLFANNELAASKVIRVQLLHRVALLFAQALESLNDDSDTTPHRVVPADACCLVAHSAVSAAALTDGEVAVESGLALIDQMTNLDSADVRSALFQMLPVLFQLAERIMLWPSAWKMLNETVDEILTTYPEQVLTLHDRDKAQLSQLVRLSIDHDNVAIVKGALGVVRALARACFEAVHCNLDDGVQQLQHMLAPSLGSLLRRLFVTATPPSLLPFLAETFACFARSTIPPPLRLVKQRQEQRRRHMPEMPLPEPTANVCLNTLLSQACSHFVSELHESMRGPVSQQLQLLVQKICATDVDSRSIGRRQLLSVVQETVALVRAIVVAK